MRDGCKVAEQGEHIVFYGLDLGSEDETAYWKYDGKRFVKISEEEYRELKNAKSPQSYNRID